MRIKARQRRRWSVINLVVWLGVVCALIFPAYQWTKSNITELAEWRNSRLSPVIMIPGSSATPNRFDTMVKKINAHAPQKHSLLKIKVWNSGKITYSGKIRPKDNEPFIVVGFQNNHDGYGNIKKQAAMFNRVFGILCSRYHFNNFKAIGHSNGGLIYTLFFEKYFHQYSDREHVDQIMTIGTPYNFSEDSITHKTQMLADFIKNRKNLPHDTDMYSVAGTENYDSDGLVPDGSVTAGKYIYQRVVRHYTEITVTGSDAEHSDLPQNPQIISLIKRDILDNDSNNKRGGRLPNRRLMFMVGN